MARIEYSGIVNTISGSIGNATFQKSGYGNSIRTKPSYRGMPSNSQTLHRSYISQIQTAWAALSVANRTAWENFNSYAPSHCKYNASVMLKGYPLFLKHNLLLINAGYPIVTTITYGSNAWQNPGGSTYIGGGTFGWDFDEAYDDDNWCVLLKATPPLKKTQLYYSNALKIIIPTIPFIGELEFYDPYMLLFGSLPAGLTYCMFLFQFLNLKMPIAQSIWAESYNL